MSEYSSEEWVGSGRITPTDPFQAGEYGSWTVEYTAGVAGIDDQGRVRLAFRSVSDWAAPNFTDPAGPNYVSAHASVPVKLTLSWGPHGVRPWTKALSVLVSGGSLKEGDKLRIVLGDRSAGSPGIRIQTYPERESLIKLQADPFGTGLYEPVADLGFEVVGGRATHLVLVAPSDAVSGEPSWLQVRALDAWGNPDPDYRGTVQFTGDVPDGVPAQYTFQPEDAGVHRFDCEWAASSEGVTRVSVADSDNGFAAESNPIRLHDSPQELRYFWGDMHGQTRETVGTGSIPAYFAYARDIAAVDVTAHSGNDFQITNEVYKQLGENAQAFYEPGKFVTFHGYEWSGNTPAGGDHNVYYFDDGPIRRSSHTQVDDTSDSDTDCYPIDRLYAANAGRDDVLITPHIGGRHANLDYHDPELEPAIEIASQWGRFEWFARDAISRGLRVAFIGGSDDHSGRPGWSSATMAHHGTRGGLTAYLANELTREGIWDALKSRRCYGTSGPRILLDVSVNGHLMGSEPKLTESPLVAVQVHGTAPIDTIEVRRGLETVHVVNAMPEVSPDDPVRVRIAWRGAIERGRSRALNWGGGATIWNGRILGAENYAIDNPVDGVTGWDENHVRWSSHTCGDWDGVILDLDGDDDTRIRFESPSMKFDFTLDELNNGPVRRKGDYLEQQVVVQRLPGANPPTDISFEWRDDNPDAGVNLYWIWVTQTDGELAWSTPVYVKWEG